MTVKLWHVLVVAGLLASAASGFYFMGRQSQGNKNSAVVVGLEAQLAAEKGLSGRYLGKLQDVYSDLKDSLKVMDNALGKIKGSIFWSGMPAGQRSVFTLQVQTIDGQLTTLINLSKQNAIAEKLTK